ncbi:flagellar type III secretion system pore protein FliP [Pelagerythrobacter marensis]|uniref:Flagellar biosynthetic protein FliP n=1 Tax=Pelagerythrobacter marensis TaxID=543877 RepID=A0A0G3XBF7_9SPHN|nr:flagellar type III secretion system pore protein FliP [Pelagerythrobacter marensis]AKM07976.1 Flagellar biosynthetic protein FliP [Pelagerythrobacter marensis]
MKRSLRSQLRVLALAGLVLPVPAIAASTDPAATEAVRVGVMLTVLAIIPALLISTTSFIRIVVVLAMIRHAFGMPQTPPNAVLTSLALFLTAFVMGPTLTDLNQDAVQPFIEGRTEISEAMENGAQPLKRFMLRHTRDADLEMVYRISDSPLPATAKEVDLLKLTPAFMLNELRVAFTIGFVILLPFLLIDLVVASILLSLGMMMVPPTTISLPIKVLMFVLIDGWSLVVEGLLGSFA